jgi:hypothetical protein
MVSREFLRCCDCDAIHRLSPFDKVPNHVYVSDGIVQTAYDDWRLFVERHGSHELETLQLTREIHAGGATASKPADAVYLEATNGRVRYLLGRFRKAEEEPFTYHVLAGTTADGMNAPE